MFSVRVLDVDDYQGVPIHSFDSTYSTFRGAPCRKVPVIRIFGATPAGKLDYHNHNFEDVLYKYKLIKIYN